MLLFASVCVWTLRIASFDSHMFFQVCKHKSTVLALGQPSKMECGTPSGREIENGHMHSSSPEKTNRCTTSIKTGMHTGGCANTVGESALKDDSERLSLLHWGVEHVSASS